MFLKLALNVSRGKTMLTLEQLETAILQLSPNDFGVAELRYEC
jgi:hypothetical protein